MKKILSFLVTFLILLSLVVTVSAESATKLSLEYDSKTLQTGEEIKVTLKIDNNSGFGTLSTAIGFDKTSYSLVSVSRSFEVSSDDYTNVHIDSLTSAANNNGWYLVGWQPKPLGNNKFVKPVKFNGELAVFTFKALKKTAANFSFKSVTIYKDDINFTKVNYEAVVNAKEVVTSVPTTPIETSSVFTTPNESANNASNIINSNSANNNNDVIVENNVETTTSQDVIVELDEPLDLDEFPKKEQGPNVLVIVIMIVLGVIALGMIGFVIYINKFMK